MPPSAHVTDGSEAFPIHFPCHLHMTNHEKEEFGPDDCLPPSSRTRKPEPSPFIVPEVLDPKDELILDTIMYFKEEDYRKDHGWNAKNPYEGKARKWLNIDVSREQRDRALRIYTAVLNAARHFGYQFVVKSNNEGYYRSCSTTIVVKGIEFPIRLFEASNRVVVDDGRWSRTDLRHNGRLRFEVGKYFFEKKTVQDTGCTRIEDKIEQLFQILERLADKEIEYRHQRELEEERLRQEEERKRIEEEERKRIAREKELERKRLANIRKEESQKLQLLLFQSQRLQVASALRQYIAALERQYTTGDSHTTPETSAQLQWMHDKLDFIDPFINKADSILTLDDLAEVLNHIPSSSGTMPSASAEPSSSHPSSASVSAEPDFWQRKYLYDKYNKR